MTSSGLYDVRNLYHIARPGPKGILYMNVRRKSASMQNLKIGRNTSFSMEYDDLSSIKMEEIFFLNSDGQNVSKKVSTNARVGGHKRSHATISKTTDVLCTLQIWGLDF